jgi:hypothetical protein
VPLSNEELDDLIETIHATFPNGAAREEIWELTQAALLTLPPEVLKELREKIDK